MLAKTKALSIVSHLLLDIEGKLYKIVKDFTFSKHDLNFIPTNLNQHRAQIENHLLRFLQNNNSSKFAKIKDPFTVYKVCKKTHYEK